MTKTQELQTQIDATNARLVEVSERIARYNVTIGEAMTGAQPNETEADRLQVERDTLRRAHERDTLRLQALQAEMPAAEKADAEERLGEIMAEAANLVQSAGKAGERLVVLLAQVETLIDECFMPLLKRKDLAGEREYLIERFHISAEPVPPIPTVDLAPIKAPYQKASALYEQIFSIWDPWREKIAAMRAEKKQHAREEKTKVVPLIAA
jgi:hypothetical protein